MSRRYPSVRQIQYTDELASSICVDMTIMYRETHKKTKSRITGNGPTNQLEMIPDSMVNEWASTAAENLRKRILAYYMETGLWPE
jgi:hypothetical protein